ncbi:MAG: hypothetical protein PHG72_01025 [Candidatus Omnitrophica bacterium]|nr:hypothetical protein [Candidatus Omnitrophota bacterium]
MAGKTMTSCRRASYAEGTCLRHKGMTMKSAKKTDPSEYLCVSCGAPTTSKGHLCTPMNIAGTSRCGFCGGVLENLHHFCKPKAEKPSFVCACCGRTSASETELCHPIKI